MGPMTGPTSHYCFAFCSEALDRQSKIGKGIAVESGALLLTLGAAPNIGRGRIVVIVARGKELVCQ
jgi:hypothetical protein